MRDGTLRRWTLLGLAIGFAWLAVRTMTLSQQVRALEFENAGQWKRISDLEYLLAEPHNSLIRGE